MRSSLELLAELVAVVVFLPLFLLFVAAASVLVEVLRVALR